MKRRTRPFSLALASAFMLLLSACGTESEESVPVAEPTPVSEAAPSAEPSSETTVATTAVADASLANAADLTGEMAFEWIPSCSLGPLLNRELDECATFAGYTILPAVLPGVRTGTFDGTENFHGIFAVEPDGDYVFAGISSFVGTVDGCGDGTVVFNSTGSGSFDLEQSAELDTLISGPIDAISYTAVASKLSTLDIALETTLTAAARTNTFDIAGTFACGETASEADAIAAVRPESAVADEPFIWTGPSTFDIGLTCNTSDLTAPDACPIVDDFLVMILDNDLVMSGSFEGEAIFVGAQLVNSDVEFEHAGIFIFDGVVEGCGEGTVINANEAVGNGMRPGFPHVRGFTPANFHPGPLGVSVDTTVRPTGVVSGEMDGTYSC